MPHICQFFQASPSHQALRTSPSAVIPPYPASASACLGSDIASSWSYPTTWPQVPLHVGITFLFTCASLKLSFGRADCPLSRLLHASSVYSACEHWARNQQAMNAWHQLKKEERAGSCRQPFPADHAIHFRACSILAYLPEGNVAVSVRVGGKIASIRSEGHCSDRAFVSMDCLK